MEPDGRGTADRRADSLFVRGLTKSFGPVRAVDGIDFEVAGGAIVGLLGGNGAGKTTTIGMILGLVEPTAGTVSVFGHDMPGARYKALPLMNFESPYVDMPRRLSVRQNLTVYGRLYGVRNIKDRIAELTEEFQLAEFIDRAVGSLSAGQRTRVGLAKAMVNRPRLLCLDEPTASLDPDTADWVRGHFERYRDQTGGAILLASHNMAEVERLCDEVYMMQRGKIIDSGPPKALIAKHGRTTMEEVFLDLARGRRNTAGAHGSTPIPRAEQ